MRYRFVLQLDRSPDDDEDCLTADEVRTTEIVVIVAEEKEELLWQVFDHVEADIVARLREAGTPHESR
jgi:hypothetical protein